MNESLFQKIISLKAVVYSRFEATNDTALLQLLDELKAWKIVVVDCDKLTACTRFVLEQELQKHQIALSDTLLLAGSNKLLTLAKDSPMATIGYREVNFGADMIVLGFEEVTVQFLDRIMKRAQGKPWITGVTDRCILREMTEDDLPDLFELYAQPGITDYTENLYDWDEELDYTRKYIRTMYHFYGYGVWLVTDKESGKLIGRAGFAHRDLGDENVLELGYVIGVPWQRRGYATEVCSYLIAFAREHLAYEMLNCFVEPGNSASFGLLQKLGFTKYGEIFVDGRRMVRYALSLDN